MTASGRAVAFALEATDDPLFDRRLRLAETARGCWIVLIYQGDPVADALRPLLRLTRDDGRREVFVLPGAGQGTGTWLGYLPPDTAAIDLAVAERGGFVLERVGLRSEASVFAECLRERPLRAISAGYQRLRGNERRMRDILRGSCAVTPMAKAEAWMAARARRDRAPIPSGPSIRLVMPARVEAAERVAATIRGLEAQSFTAWSLVVGWSEPGCAVASDDARIEQTTWPAFGRVGDFLNGDNALALLTPGDGLDPDALAILVRTLAEPGRPQMVYADAWMEGAGAKAALKPDWSPDLALVTAYSGTPTLYAGGLLERLRTTPLGEPDTLATRLVLAAVYHVGRDEVAHVPRLLSRAAPPSPDSAERHAAILQAHLAETRIPARVEAHPSGSDLLWDLPEPPPLVSVVIPSRDRLELIRVAADGVLNGTAYPAIELVIVDNGSTDPAVLAHYEDLRRDPRVRILSCPGPFNFSAMINAGVAGSRGDVLVLLNNDVAVLREDWLEALVRQACRPEIGAVGAKLLYADGTLQHAGVVVGLGGRAGHILRRRPADTPGMLGRMRVAHEVSAVTAACLAVGRAKFDSVGGLDAEAFAVDFNDVDFCLRLAAAGYRTIWTPRAVMAHLESTSRGPAVGAARQRFEQEADRFVERWRDTIRHDPYYHPALTLTTFGEDLE
ncbi:glycosyl transferase [Methylobacterium sp. Leaf104]|nr:glycosyl transferase [Methylobacterium sp. Leaf104]MCI9881302.1 glycosyltransferase [Methylobacterium goesingense]